MDQLDGRLIDLFAEDPRVGVLEVHTITGAGDMWARVVARSNTDLQRVIDRVLDTPAIVRSSTVIALATQVPYRVRPLARSVTVR